MLEAAYRMLRVSKGAPPDEVRKSYVRLVRRYPPEHFPEKFAELRDAYQQLTLSDDFIDGAAQRLLGSESALGMAACLWGDREELIYEERFVPEELAALLKGDDTRRGLYALLTPEQDIEWRTGDGE